MVISSVRQPPHCVSDKVQVPNVYTAIMYKPLGSIKNFLLCTYVSIVSITHSGQVTVDSKVCFAVEH